MSVSTISAASAMVIRTATARSQCCCAAAVHGHRIPLRSHTLEADPAGRKAAGDYTGMALAEPPPDCLNTIEPGDRYIEDTRGTPDGNHYCLRCGIERAAAGV